MLMNDVITFEPVEHKYTNQHGEEYISVTTLIGKEMPFDSKAIAEKVRKIGSSRYHNMTTERILALWDASADHGTVVHDMVEQYIKEDIVPSDPSLVPLLDQFKKLNFRGDLLSEVLVWSEKYKVAGLVDILEVFDDKIFLYDIKTSNRIGDDKYMKFSMQLEMYRRFIEESFNKPTSTIAILWYQDYVLKRSKTKLKMLQTLHVEDSVDDILEKRLKEIT